MSRRSICGSRDLCTDPLSATVPDHDDSGQLMNSADRYPKNETTWKMTVKQSALVTVMRIRVTIGPPMIGPMLHDNVDITPVTHPTDQTSTTASPKIVPTTFATLIFPATLNFKRCLDSVKHLGRRNTNGYCQIC